MSDRPILFSAAMVLALLAGTKTQTRRALNPQLAGTHARLASKGSVTWDFITPGNPERLHGSVHLRFAVGDRLWVRESYMLREDIDGKANPEKARHYALYRASAPGAAEDEEHWHPYPGRWTPSLHMPRRASRLTLHVTEVRVQRLQEISDEDAWAEGISDDLPVAGIEIDIDGQWWAGAARRRYRKLWDSINGAGAWDANPWVVAITFGVEHANIDAARLAA